MEYIRSKAKDIYLGDTPIENIFLNEFLPSAPGDFVKVYLYARLYAETGRALSDRNMAAQLGLVEERILEAWEYWENMGAVRRHYLDGEGKMNFSVEFLSLKEQLYGGGGEDAEAPETAEAPEQKSVFGSEAVKELMRALEKKLGRTLSSTEMEQVIGWAEDLGLPPEVIELGVDYCAGSGKTSFRYINRVMESWSQKGLRTADAVADHLEENDQRFNNYRRVMKALGFSRNPSEAEMALMDSWFGEMGYHMDRVLEACAKTAGISNPNLKYVDGVLRGWKAEAREQKRDVNDRKPVTLAVLNRYYDYLRHKAEKEAEERRREIYRKLPEIEEIDNKIQELGTELSRALILNGAKGSGRRLNEEMEKLNVDRAVILTENDYDMDYTDVKYNCSKCNDTGITDMGERCTCIETRMAEAEKWLRETEGKRNG